MKKYTSQSVHTIGYSWEIEAPDELSDDDVKAVQDALCNYTDEPNEQRLQEMLNEELFCEDYFDILKINLMRKIQFYIEVVHRESYTQEFTSQEGE